MKSKAEIRNAIVDLSGPAPGGVSQPQVDTARRVLSWVLGQHGEKDVVTAVFETTCGTPAVAPYVPTAPPPPAT